MNQAFEKIFYEKISKKKLRVFLSVMCSMFRSVLVLIPTLLMRDIYNSLELGLDANNTYKLILLTFVIPIIVAASYSFDIRMSKYIFMIIKEIRTQALKHIVSMKLRSILALNKSVLFQRMMVSLEELGEYYYYFINTNSWYITTSIVGVLLMLMINVQITMGLLCFSLLQIGCSMVLKKRIETVKELESELQTKGCDYIVRIMEHNAFLKAARLEENEIRRESAWEHEAWNIYKKKIINSQSVAVISFLLTFMRTLYLFFAVHELLLAKQMLKGDFIALNTYIVWLAPVFAGLQECIEDMIIARENKRRVNRYLEDDMAEENMAGIVPPSASVETMDVINLSFSYEDIDCPVFSNLSFQVKRGETLFITGPSGVGKSTLLSILSGLETAYGGEVSYNGCELHQLDDSWIRRNTILVSQDVDVLPTTLRHNILYSGIQADDERVKDVLCALKLEHLLDMPGGLDWDMKKHLRVLSDGEKKRISIARAILGRPNVLLLDEPTAGLDNVNKQAVIRFIEQNVNGILIIVVHDSVFAEGANVLQMTIQT